MPLFQQSVAKKYINDLNQTALQNAWTVFSGYFHNAEIQANIRNLKEEAFQEGFIRELFVNVLGYTLNPQPGYNLVLEQKSVTDATKADAAILQNNQVIGVIELKDTGTPDLDKVSTQAFGYKHKHKNCTYVITSNFEKLRFYINDATEYEEFDLFNLTRQQFSLLYLCLQQEKLIGNIALEVKQASLVQEENVTKQLYADYSLFKRKLFQNITEQNPQYDKLLLFKKTQKLLDRFLFIFFAEDRLLLPPNSIREILKQWETLKELDNYVPLYTRFKKYFGYLNTGHSGKHYEIFAYNGGLFAPDELLDNIAVDDAVLFDATRSLSNYDFETDIDVNILGHIFEHSLSEIEELQAELEGKAIEKKTTKRKKDGVFYTPRYITKYIVENTVGALCTQKREELDITEESFAPQKRRDRRKLLQGKLEAYRNWLLQLTICDPACGSGAFLNAALEYLKQEHRTIDELLARVFGDAIVYTDIDNEILERNLFGVDINEEAIEIAKLSLWLRTAKKGRKLSALSNNIKCGNSLIDDPAVAGDKAFVWQEEFKAVFDNGGFDVVIGNPPYVDIKALPADIVDYIYKVFKTSNNRINLFASFIERSIVVLKNKGMFSFIIPSAILTQESYKELRKKLLTSTTIISIIRLPNESFGGGAGEVKVDTIILTFQNKKDEQSNTEILVYKGFERINEIDRLTADYNFHVDQKKWFKDDFVFRINADDSINTLLTKIESGSVKFVDCAEFCLGLTPYDKYRGHTQEQIENRVFHSNYKKDETFKKLLAGNDITRYNVHWNGDEWISYGAWLGAPRDRKFFIEKRILVKQIIDWSSKRIWAALTDEELYNTQNAFNILSNENYYTEYLVAILNSRLITFYHKKKFLEEYKDRFQKILIRDCKELPIKKIIKEQQQPFILKADVMLSKNKELNQLAEQFIQLLKATFPSLNINNKLQNWYSLTIAEFLKELSKQKIKLSLSQQQEWLQYFSEQQTKANQIQQLISQTDKEIDAMVYQLYGLTREEIQIVESS